MTDRSLANCLAQLTGIAPDEQPRWDYMNGGLWSGMAAFLRQHGWRPCIHFSNDVPAGDAVAINAEDRASVLVRGGHLTGRPKSEIDLFLTVHRDS